MTKCEGKAGVIDLKGFLARDEDFVRAAAEGLVQVALEAEMTEAIGAGKGERTETRLSYRSGYYGRSLITRVGTLELRGPRDRLGRFFTELFERYQRSEKALVGTLGEDVCVGGFDAQGQGGNRGIVRAQLLGLGDQRDQQVPRPEPACFAERRLDENFPYLILCALREGARGRSYRQPGGAGRRRSTRVSSLSDLRLAPMAGAEAIPGYTGPVSRSRQTIIQPGRPWPTITCSVVNFSEGCTTGWHTHNCDQLLIVTSGSGMVATEDDQREITVGDVVHIEAGERHWHGAKADTTMGHITVTLRR